MSSRFKLPSFGKGSRENGNGNGQHPAKVLIAVPCQDQVSAMFAYDLRVLELPPGTEIHCVFHRGTLIADQRQKLAEIALEQECSHILWLDSDMRFPKDTLKRLLAHDKDVVAANYVTRRHPTKPVAMIALSETERVDCFTLPDSEGLEAVAHVGMGVMLTKTSVFTKYPKPWFYIEYNPLKGNYAGEDVFFCRCCEHLKIPIYVDHDLSKQVKHCGEREYHHEHVNPERVRLTYQLLAKRQDEAKPVLEVVES